jgi:arylsulfatase A-like enzyme
MTKRPNLLFVFADQWRAQATGYAGDVNVPTPFLDRLQKQSIDCCNAVSGYPVCTPYRASVMSGRYPHQHGCFANNVPLDPETVSIGKCFRDAGYRTGYIGKWHIDGYDKVSGFSNTDWIPPERRLGFDYWRGCEGGLDYWKMVYYDDNGNRCLWPGYAPFSQTDDAIAYMERHRKEPFCLFLSWTPPHAPYTTAPQEHRERISSRDIVLPPNVPDNHRLEARKCLTGYYAHMAALDDCVGRLTDALERLGLEDDTILVFTSDHGDMCGSKGHWDKTRPYDEAVRAPFLIRWPGGLGREHRTLQMTIDGPDIMPTLLGLTGLPVPDTCSGRDWSAQLRGDVPDDPEHAALLQNIACKLAFREHGIQDWRGIRTARYTYVIDHDGPWLLYDNKLDPWQEHNRIEEPAYTQLRKSLHTKLMNRMAEVGDTFLQANEYYEKWGYVQNAHGLVVDFKNNRRQGPDTPKYHNKEVL